jgi:hypothetical protein
MMFPGVVSNFDAQLTALATKKTLGLWTVNTSLHSVGTFVLVSGVVEPVTFVSTGVTRTWVMSGRGVEVSGSVAKY